MTHRLEGLKSAASSLEVFPISAAPAPTRMDGSARSHSTRLKDPMRESPSTPIRLPYMSLAAVRLLARKTTKASTTKADVNAQAIRRGSLILVFFQSWLVTSPTPWSSPKTTYVHAAPCQSPAMVIDTSVTAMATPKVSGRKSRAMGVYRYVVMKLESEMCHRLQ